MRQLPGRPKLIRHRVSIANGAALDSLSELFIFPNKVINALGEAEGAGAATAAAIRQTVATGTPAGASTLAGAAIRIALPTGTTAGVSGITGAAIRRAVATGALGGAGSTISQGKRIVWTTGTLTGAASVVIGVPTTRIFAPAWGNSSLTGDTQVDYVGQATAWSPTIVTGLGGYVLVESTDSPPNPDSRLTDLHRPDHRLSELRNETIPVPRVGFCSTASTGSSTGLQEARQTGPEEIPSRKASAANPVTATTRV